jgi:hypothetical protein
VIGVKHTATVLSARSEFDAFLFASIGEEKNGTPLSVLSALARLEALEPFVEVSSATAARSTGSRIGPCQK